MLDMPLPNLFEELLGKDEDAWPPEASFLVAAHRGNVRRLKEIARDLDDCGWGTNATVAAITYRGMNALHAAAGLGKLCVYRYLVDVVKMDVNKPDTSPCKKTPLEHAVDRGHLPAVRFLLDHGADLHQENEKNVTVLFKAANKGRCEIVKLLLSRGAHVDGNSESGTPLHFAALKGYESTVEALLEYHADLLMCELAQANGEQQSTHQQLLKTIVGAKPNKVVASHLVTPLDAAIRAPSSSCVKLLIQAGANVNGVNNSLARAASEGLTEAVKCLLEAGANPNRPDEFGRLPIELAAVYGTREDVELLYPLTSPIPTVANWSVDGIIDHAKLERIQLEDDDVVKLRKSEPKQQGDEAFERQDYTNAAKFYTEALKVDRHDAKMLSNRSRCWLKLGDGEKALEDATRCVSRDDCAEGRRRQGEALMLLKEYKKACEALSRGLELEPESDEMDKLFWEAMELMQKQEQEQE